MIFNVYHFLLQNKVGVFEEEKTNKCTELAVSNNGYLCNLHYQTRLNFTTTDSNIQNQHIQSRYYSPSSFYVLKNRLSQPNLTDSSFSLLHNNVRSLRRNLENLQVHLLDELVLQL